MDIVDNRDGVLAANLATLQLLHCWILNIHETTTTGEIQHQDLFNEEDIESSRVICSEMGRHMVLA